MSSTPTIVQMIPLRCKMPPSVCGVDYHRRDAAKPDDPVDDHSWWVTVGIDDR
jgi:hypothetical protein